MKTFGNLKRCFPLLALRFVLILIALASHSGANAQDGEELRVGSLRVTRVAFLGNSITLHPPAPHLGWKGDWGMAAGGREQDYVHLLVSYISQSTGKEPAVLIKNIGEFESILGAYEIETELEDVARFEADLIILAIGENCQTPGTEVDRRRFSNAMLRLIEYLKATGQPTILVRSQFWPVDAKDALLEEAAETAGAIWVDLGQIGSDPSNFAQSEREIENESVGIHPGDKGMEAIADTLWIAILEQGDATRE